MPKKNYFDLFNSKNNEEGEVDDASLGILFGLFDTPKRSGQKFSVGDHVRIKWREQEGTVIDVNGKYYTVSLNSGSTETCKESDLKRTF